MGDHSSKSSNRSLETLMASLNDSASGRSFEPVSTEIPSLKSMIAESIKRLSDSTTERPTTALTNARLVIFLYSNQLQLIGDSWTYTDADGSQLSIADLTESLIIENNARSKESKYFQPINRLELSILVFVPEQPSEPLEPIESSHSPPSIVFTTTLNASSRDMTESAPDTPSPSQTTSPRKDTDVIEWSTRSYHHNPSHFSDGSILPPSKDVSSGLNFVCADLSFVRPSFTHQVIVDLSCSHYALSQLNIRDVPFRESHLPSDPIVASRVSLLLASEPLFSSYRTSSAPISTPLHIGKQLGTGIGHSVSVSWKPYDPRLSIHSLPCKSIIRVTSEYPSHRPTKSLLAAICEGKPVLLCTDSSGSQSSLTRNPSYLLTCQGSHIYAHQLKENDDITLLDTTQNPFGTDWALRSIRSHTMQHFIEENLFAWTTFSSTTDTYRRQKSPHSNSLTIPVAMGASGRSVDLSNPTTMIQDTSSKSECGYRTTKRLELATRVFPFFEDDSILYKPLKHGGELLQNIVDPIRRALLRSPPEVITIEEITVVHHALGELRTWTTENDRRLFPHTSASVQKRRDLYAKLWAELIALSSKHRDISPMHVVIATDIQNIPQNLRTSTVPKPDDPSSSTLSNLQGANSSSKSSSAMDVSHSSSSTTPSTASALPSTSTPNTSAEAAKAAENKWLYDVSTVRHDIVGLKDMSWSGAPMTNPDVPLPTAEMNPSSLYAVYWNAAASLVKKQRNFP